MDGGPPPIGCYAPAFHTEGAVASLIICRDLIRGGAERSLLPLPPTTSLFDIPKPPDSPADGCRANSPPGKDVAPGAAGFDNPPPPPDPGPALRRSRLRWRLSHSPSVPRPTVSPEQVRQFVPTAPQHSTQPTSRGDACEARRLCANCVRARVDLSMICECSAV
jgi:hypothetical protein